MTQSQPPIAASAHTSTLDGLWLGIYSALWCLAAPLVVLSLWFKGRQLPGYRERIGERFGFIHPLTLPSTAIDPAANHPATSPTAQALEPKAIAIKVWVHAVSVGETIAAIPLIEALLDAHGERSVWVTSTTPTGSARVKAAFGKRVQHSYVPYDLPMAIRRFLSRVQPERLVIMETELWPNLLHACRQQNIPVVIANARLSPRSFRGYARFQSITSGMLANCSRIGAQTRADARRFMRLGAPVARVSVTGNLKYEVKLPEARINEGRQLRDKLGSDRPVWIAASTHEGEEAAALTAHQAVLEQFPDAVLILVPRHPQRFDGIWKQIEASGLRGERRSRALAMAHAGFRAALSRTQVLLGDTMGEMFMYLAAADVAFVGGSLVSIGGHNVLEPAALGMPVVFGPHMTNFAAARGLLLRQGAAVEVATEAELAAEISVLLSEPATRAAMGRAGEAAVAGNRGALQKILRIVENA